MTALDPTRAEQYGVAVDEAREMRWLVLDQRSDARASDAQDAIRAEAIHHRRAIGQHARQALARWMRETGRAP